MIWRKSEITYSNHQQVDMSLKNSKCDQSMKNSALSNWSISTSMLKQRSSHCHCYVKLAIWLIFSTNWKIVAVSTVDHWTKLAPKKGYNAEAYCHSMLRDYIRYTSLRFSRGTKPVTVTKISEVLKLQTTCNEVILYEKKNFEILSIALNRLLSTHFSKKQSCKCNKRRDKKS
jgi:hypothetical protein